MENETSAVSSTIELLVQNKVASRIHAKDATLYDFSPEALDCAQNFMGWVDLASNPPYPIAAVQACADEMVGHGTRTVVLIGQGGSTQAAQTITKYNKLDSNRVSFKTLDSDSPVRVRQILSECNPQTTLFIVSSKSGSTLEPRMALNAIRQELAKTMPLEAIPKHLVAITDPGSDLEKLANDEGWAHVFLGEPTVGGRYSALSVFSLFPAALVGIKLGPMMERARAAEAECSADSPENPAIQLAAFLYDNYCTGRDKFSFLTPKRGRVLGLWIEQLVAESLGKQGTGILPNIEIDSLVLAKDPGDRTAILCRTKNDLADETANFTHSLNYVDPAIPHMSYSIDSASELAGHFLMWEYATAMCGYLMKVCPFDQPDVTVAKKCVLGILEQGQPEPQYSVDTIGGIAMGTCEISVSDSLREGLASQTLEDAVKVLVSSIQPGDYFAMLAFLPFTGEGRREALESMRHGIAEHCGVPSCLEVGPRYLHSTGQLHKGGKNNGVFLVLSADEAVDIPLVDAVAPSLGTLAKAQAAGDFATLSSRGRRCVHVHLPSNAGVTLRALAGVLEEAYEEYAQQHFA